MKAKAKKTAHRTRKKAAAATPTKLGGNGVSSPYGFRVVEMEWMNKHPEKLRPYAGEYVVVEGTRVVAHSTDAAEAIRVAKQQGVVIPFILFLEKPDPNVIRIGL